MEAGPGHAMGMSSLQGGWSELETSPEEAGTRSRRTWGSHRVQASFRRGGSRRRCRSLRTPSPPIGLPRAGPPWALAKARESLQFRSLGE